MSGQPFDAIDEHQTGDGSPPQSHDGSGFALTRLRPFTPLSYPVNDGSIIEQMIELETLRIERSLARIGDLQALQTDRDRWVLAESPVPVRLPLTRPMAALSGKSRIAAVAAAAGAAGAALVLLWGTTASAPQAPSEVKIVLPEPATSDSRVTTNEGRGLSPEDTDSIYRRILSALEGLRLPEPRAGATQPSDAADFKPRIPLSYLMAVESGRVERWTDAGAEKFVLAGATSDREGKTCRRFLVWEKGGAQGAAAEVDACVASGRDFRDAQLEPVPKP